MKDDKTKSIVIDSRAWTGDYNADNARDIARQHANQERLQAVHRNYPGVMSVGYAALTTVMSLSGVKSYFQGEHFNAFASAIFAVVLAFVTLALARRALKRFRGR